MENEIKFIKGDQVVDDRGSVKFVNDFTFEGVKRFYLVENHQIGFIRAWHGHKREEKYVLVVDGVAIVAAVRIDNWDSPSKTSAIERYVLSANKPSILYIPAGYANGFKSLTPDSKILFFSTSTLEDSKNDDIRFDSNYFGRQVWEIIER